MPGFSANLSPIQLILNDLHRRLRDNCEGELATYIPELGNADPNWFGICLVTADGAVTRQATPLKNSRSSRSPSPSTTESLWKIMVRPRF